MYGNSCCMGPFLDNKGMQKEIMGVNLFDEVSLLVEIPQVAQVQRGELHGSCACRLQLFFFCVFLLDVGVFLFYFY